MPIEAGSLCQYCADDHGSLREFAECFERFVQFACHQEKGLSRAAAEGRTLEFMGRMPAWRDHPQLAAYRATRP